MIKSIPGYDGYFADELGNIYSTKIRKYPVKLKPKIFKADGRRLINVSINGKIKTVKVASLILTAFVSERPTGMFACHKKEGCKNDSIENLYWGTCQQNTDDRERDGNTAKGESHYNHRLTEKDVRYIRSHCILRDKNGFAPKDFAKIYGVHQSLITGILSRRKWGWLSP